MLKPLLILRNKTENWNRDQIHNGYVHSIALADMVLIVNNNNTFTVLKNKWGKQCSSKGFEVVFPMDRLNAFVNDPEVEGSKLV